MAMLPALVAKAEEAERLMVTARDQAHAAKAKYKEARKNYKEAKKQAKKARKEAKDLAKAGSRAGQKKAGSKKAAAGLLKPPTPKKQSDGALPAKKARIRGSAPKHASEPVSN